MLLALVAVSSVIAIYYLERFAGFDRPTAYFSGMPGGLIEMIVLGEEHRADLRAIALVHSVRILVVVFTLPIIISLLEGVVVQTSSVPRPSLFETEFAEFMWLAVTAVLGIVVGHLLRMPALYLLGPMLVSAGIHIADLSEFTMPVEILNFAQYVVGTTVGCRFVGVGSRTIFRIFAIFGVMSAALLAVTALFAWASTFVSPYGFAPIFIAYAPGGLPEMSLDRDRHPYRGGFRRLASHRAPVRGHGRRLDRLQDARKAPKTGNIPRPVLLIDLRRLNNRLRRLRAG